MATTKLSVFALLLLIVMIGWIKNSSVFINKSIDKMSMTNQVVVAETQNVCKWKTSLEGTLYLSVYFSDKNIGIVGAPEEQFWLTRDGGKSWIAKSIVKRIPDKQKPGTFDLIKVVIKPPNKLYALGFLEGGMGAIFSSIDFGKSWDVQYFEDTGFYDISIVSDDIWILAYVPSENREETFSPILLHNNAAGSWDTIWKGGKHYVLNGMTFTNSQNGWMVGSEGLILHTIDGGHNWKEIKAPTQNALTSIEFQHSMEGYAIGQRGTFLQTSDGGKTWSASRISSNIPIHNNYQSLAITKSGAVWVGGMLGRILFTRNKGADWEPIVAFPIDGGAYDIFTIENKVWVATGDDRLLVCE